MKNKHSLVLIGDKVFVMLDLNRHIRNYQCNNIIFKSKEDAKKDIGVFEYFNVKVVDIVSELNNSSKNIKNLIKEYGSFSVSFLPEIKDRLDNYANKKQ